MLYFMRVNKGWILNWKQSVPIDYYQQLNSNMYITLFTCKWRYEVVNQWLWNSMMSQTRFNWFFFLPNWICVATSSGALFTTNLGCKNEPNSNVHTANLCSDFAVEVQSNDCNLVFVTVIHCMQCSTALYCSE